MALVDLISAKLEATETRMEDRLCALFTEFRLRRSSSPTRLQQGKSPDQKENPLENEECATKPAFTCMRVDFPDGKIETRRDGFCMRNTTFIITKPQRLSWWTSLPSTLKEMLYNGTIDTSTPTESPHGANHENFQQRETGERSDYGCNTVLGEGTTKRVQRLLNQIQELQEMKPKKIKDVNPLPMLAEISGASAKMS
ncbi:hypothetical protein B296_00015353 [Ensete ventricosum]|uniref:Uncharacterized protein n=1 Tax=Ensete ventricosum TaxID=4639 RepID=A0A427A5Y5_ENSVE|nr:hypothetical protein B296_00015353 [Ensete ventricosum]